MKTLGFKKFGLIVVVLLATGLTLGAYYTRRGGAEPEVVTAHVDRGDIVDAVGATGAVEAVTTVQVGTQVSGSVSELYADFNSIVKKGQVVARLDPALFQTQVDQARANLAGAQADKERLTVAVSDAATKLKRAQELWDRQLIAAMDLDAAQVSLRSAEAQVKSAEAQITQAQASLNQADVNLAKTVITAPIDGIVISRNVDIGQTVAASLQAPTLFVIAADLSKMRVKASIDEADVGRISHGQTVTFRVDAYPSESFTGTVSQVRLEPVIEQNVVTYAALVDVPNPKLKLKPGMTATLSIEVARRDNILRVPVSALRFKPSTETFETLGQKAPVAAEGVKPRRTDQVWQYADGKLTAVNVTTGATDGRLTEIVTGNLTEGASVVTSVASAKTAAASLAPATAGNPLMGAQPPRGPGGGGGRR